MNAKKQSHSATWGRILAILLLTLGATLTNTAPANAQTVQPGVVVVDGKTAVTVVGGKLAVYAIGANGALTRSATLEPTNALTDFGGFRAVPGAVALKGDWLVAGAPETNGGKGAAVLFKRTGAAWAEVSVIEGDGELIGFGRAVAISADTVAVSGTDEAQRGGVELFKLQGGDGSPVARLYPDTPEDKQNFGAVLALDGDYLVVGSAVPADKAGVAFVFVQTDGDWGKPAPLVSDDSKTGDRFGSAVAISGRTVVIGAPGSGSNSAYIFTRGDTSWGQRQKLPTDPGATGSGRGVAILDTLIAVSTDSGVTLFDRQGTTSWIKQTTVTPVSGMTFSGSVAVSKDLAVIVSSGPDQTSLTTVARAAAKWGKPTVIAVEAN